MHEWMFEYGIVVSADAADRNRLIREAGWDERGYETVFWLSGLHVRQACLEARGRSPLMYQAPREPHHYSQHSKIRTQSCIQQVIGKAKPIHDIA